MDRITSPFGAFTSAREVAAGHDLSGRTVIVTGGATGIGIETARALAEQGADVVIAARKPGEWQSYDIVFRRPRFDGSGKVTSPARVTVLHNGVLVQDNVELTGPTGHYARPPYSAHADRLPISLQDHGHPVRFRNFWVRTLEPR